MSRAIHGGNVWDASRRFTRDPRTFLDFSSNINPLGPPRSVMEALAHHLSDVSFYPDPQAWEARDCLAVWLGIPPESLLLTNGGAEALYLVLSFYRPRRVLIPIPTFVESLAGVEAMGGEIREVALLPHQGFRLPVDAVLNELHSVDLIYLCNPNNPTGVLTPKLEILRIVEEARDRCVLLVDEAFIDFAGREQSLVREASRMEGVVVFGSLTKLFALPGLRLGYAVAAPSTIRSLSTLQPPWSVNVLAQHALIAAIADEAYAAESRRLIHQERAFLFSGLGRQPGCNPFPSAANFLLVDIQGSGLRSGDLWERLGRRGILVRDGASIRGLGDRYIRVGVRTREENSALLRALSEEILR